MEKLNRLNQFARSSDTSSNKNLIRRWVFVSISHFPISLQQIISSVSKLLDTKCDFYLEISEQSIKEPHRITQKLSGSNRFKSGREDVMNMTKNKNPLHI